MKIIFIHGMNQQNHTAESLKQHWLNIFQQGLSCGKYPLKISDLKIGFPFYGDLLLLHHQQNNIDMNTLLPKTLFHFPLHLQREEKEATEHSEFIPFLPHESISQTLPISEKLALFTAISKDLILKEFTILLNRFPRLHEQLIHRFLIETYLYLSNECFLREVHNRILQTLSPHEQHIVVAHSLGTVIAYNLLYRHPEFKIKNFITLGSPLAFRVVQDKIMHPIIRPAGIQGNWINFYSHDDFLTAFPLSCAPFTFTPPICNHEISTFANRPHEIIGYLQHPDVVQKIIQPLLKR